MVNINQIILLVQWVLIQLLFTLKLYLVLKIKENKSDILYAYKLTETPGYMTVYKPTNVSYQNVTRDRIEYFEFSIRDEHDRPIVFNDYAMIFISHLVLF